MTPQPLVLRLSSYAVILSEAHSAQSKDPEALQRTTAVCTVPTSESNTPRMTPQPLVLRHSSYAVILSGAHSAQSKDPEAPKVTHAVRTFSTTKLKAQA